MVISPVRRAGKTGPLPGREGRHKILYCSKAGSIPTIPRTEFGIHLTILYFEIDGVFIFFLRSFKCFESVANSQVATLAIQISRILFGR